MLLLSGVVVGVIDCETGFVAFGHVHGDIGVAHESLRVTTMLREASYTHARADIERLSFVQNRTLEGSHNAFGTIDYLRGGSACQQNSELVAAETRDATSRIHDASETLRN
jgi:hypothetical protein